ncbi:hypothetical protein L6164_009555 [Bauhinia variegata]|uniref:Uncharacterized protein n=1 Tax=Bauhinia variegata TaxID=167791 RepID=A0ACB9PLL4_BAUVA|nr:hypothetical protein L6164_009555 [Bauhinia variegata]
MVEGGNVPFSVVFFDGERETNVGNIMVNSSLNFKILQSVLSQKIGISPNQFSVYLASSGGNRKIPITGKVNFAAVSRENGAYFFVKRTKRSRKNKTQKEHPNGEHYPPTKVAQSNKNNPPGNVMLLRRNPGFENQPLPQLPGYQAPIIDRVEYERRVRNLQVERERYLLNMGLNDLWLERGSNGGGEGKAKGGDVVCEECSRAKQTGRDVGFHWCVCDAVTVGFRSPAGPIARPMKRSG